MDPSAGPTHVPRIELDEPDHQALDLLDALPCGAAWQAVVWAKRGGSEASGPAPEAELAAAITAADEDPAEVEAAVERIGSVFEAVIASVAATLLDAAAALAKTEARGQLDPEQLTAAHSALAQRAALALKIPPAVELGAEILGLTPGSIAHAVLNDLAAREQPDVPASLAACAGAIAQRLQAARETTTLAPELAKPLRVFHLAALAGAGPSVRARVLAADAPDLLGLATRLVGQTTDAALLVDSFDRARAASDGPPPDPHELIDGPKRKFTIVHVILAAIILGLTLWHYLWR